MIPPLLILLLLVPFLQRLFEAEGWFTHKEAKQVGTHYGGYSISPRKGLRVLCINTDFWYKGNVFNYINTTNPDTSGTLRFLTDELELAHRRHERVWIVGHVLTGWDGSNPLANPTNLFYQIVDHYSPNTIAHIFFGHTHEDQFNVFYSHNATLRQTPYAKAVSFMSPSITPGSNVNSALRIYEVDPETYSVQDYLQYYTQVADFPTLETGPVWRHLYSAREAYSNFSSSYPNGTLGNGIQLDYGSIWPSSSPLNATFWSAVTDEMLARPDLVKQFSRYQARNSTTGHYCVLSTGCSMLC
jgi:sphingomyelin phosphodiesterase